MPYFDFIPLNFKCPHCKNTWEQYLEKRGTINKTIGYCSPEMGGCAAHFLYSVGMDGKVGTSKQVNRKVL